MENTQVKVIANRVDNEEDAADLFLKLNAVVTKYLKIPITYLGSVPRDEQLAKAVMQQSPISMQNPNAKSAKAYEEIAMKLMDKEVSTSVPKRGMAAFFSHILAGRKK